MVAARTESQGTYTRMMRFGIKSNHDAWIDVDDFVLAYRGSDVQANILQVCSLSDA
jgi:hypothetical protein